MTIIRLALAQVNPTVGDLAGNAAIVVARTRDAVAAGADLVAFPEMMLTGYPIEDLALRESFQRASRAALGDLARELADEGCGGVGVVVGFLDAVGDQSPEPSPGYPRGGARNAAAVLFGGQVVAVYAKHHLPNYGVFDEFRYFVPGDEGLLVRLNGVDVALAICEDLWQPGGPVAEVRAAGAGLLVVINGSPYERAKDDLRLDLCRRRATEAGCTLAYVNMVGGQDELVFDGDSMVVGGDGEVLARAYEFVEQLVVLDLDLPGAQGQHCDTSSRQRVELTTAPALRPQLPAASVAPELDDAPEVYRALVLGLRDYVGKNGFETVALGLSGGIDSALVAAIACDAIGAANVIGVSMPSKYSSQHSRDDAADLAERTGLQYRTVPIAPLVAAFDESLGLTGLAEENLQARVRGVTLMGISNAEGPLVLATGNKSEIAVGYSTIYGDAVGGFAPIKDVPKSLVWKLAHWRNAHAQASGETAPIPPNSITKAPSAELRPDQLDSDSLPDYALLDDILDAYVEHDRGAQELLAAGFEHEVVERIVRLIDFAEYKRRQYPPGTKITFKAFGRDRRLPITNRWREHPTP
ncbi:MAG: NAD+ synthase [Candidatus Nanopelagicales bacterium]